MCTFAVMNRAPTAIFSLPAEVRHNRKWAAFHTPRAVWQATRHSELPACFARVSELQHAGRFVIMLLTYEASQAFDSALCTHTPGTLPLAWFAAFDEQTEWTGSCEEFELGQPVLRVQQSEYVEKVHEALEHIRAGNIYQVNYTVRAHCSFRGSARGLFHSLVHAVPVPNAAFADTGTSQIVSLSPELFLERRGDLLSAKPMKGTAPRKPSWDEDEAARSALEQSEKDRAENTMIVDLMRNDLGRVCETGTIRVPELCKTYRYPTVHQMISTVTGTLRPNVSNFEIFSAAFPPGSVTGAPKVRATSIIHELEPKPRGIYCGTVGLFMPGGDFVCNVAIRTLEIQGNTAVLGIGSGIVADSIPEQEWKEVLLKKEFARQRPQPFGLYETFRWQPDVGYRNLHSHLRRLKRSCDYFSRPFPIREIVRVLRELKTVLGNNPNRVRLDVNGMHVSTELLPEELGWPERGVVLMISATRLDPDDPRLYHKTTLRPEKNTARAKAKELGADECLFLNTHDEFTEGSIANVLFKVRGEWITPKLECGLLPGVWRDIQIHSGRAREGVVRFSELSECEEVHIGNSVRGEGKVVRIITESGDEVYSSGGRQ